MIFQIIIGIDTGIGGYLSSKLLIDDVQVGRLGGCVDAIDDPNILQSRDRHLVSLPSQAEGVKLGNGSAHGIFARIV